MYKTFCLILSIFLLSFSIFAADKNPAQKKITKQAKIQAPKNRTAQIKDLENKRRMLSMKIFQTRVKLISEDSDMLMLHNQIMKLHKQLAIELNNNEEMKSLLTNAKDIDTQIDNLINTKTDTDSSQVDSTKKETKK